MKALIFTLAAATFWTASVGQTATDMQLAAQYLQEGEYDKAGIYFEKAYGATGSDEYFEALLQCYLATENHKAALRLAEYHANKFPSDLNHQVTVGVVLSKIGEPEKAEKQFAKTLKSIDNASVAQILSLGEAFSKAGRSDLALSTYQNGRKHIGNAYPFHFQIAPLLAEQGNVQGMIDELLDVLLVSGGYLQSVQSTLNRTIGLETDSEANRLLQASLAQRVQRYPDQQLYADMLLWLYLKQGKYEAALQQAMAIDKRQRADGTQVMDVAMQCADAEKYAVARTGYEYVLSKGLGNYHYFTALQLRLLAMKKQCERSGDAESVANLMQAYEETIAQHKNNQKVIELVLDYAVAKAFLQAPHNENATDESAALLEEILPKSVADKHLEARVKTALADVYVLQNRVWDASLLYGQVEKAFKHDEIGHRAKLNNAKVFYYSGDFAWARAQLKVLKGSTSKLISNDAIELSAFITENTATDSVTVAVYRFATAELMVRQRRFAEAQSLLDSLTQNFPGHAIADDVVWLGAQILSETGKADSAVAQYDQLVAQWPDGVLADNALMAKASLCENRLADVQCAMEAYRTILARYPGSLFVVEARKRFRELRGDEL